MFKDFDWDRLTKNALAILAAAGLFALTYYLLSHTIPEGANKEYIGMVVTAVIFLAKECYSFVFGSSQSSRDKDEALLEKK